MYFRERSLVSFCYDPVQSCYLGQINTTSLSLLPLWFNMITRRQFVDVKTKSAEVDKTKYIKRRRKEQFLV